MMYQYKYRGTSRAQCVLMQMPSIVCGCEHHVRQRQQQEAAALSAETALTAAELTKPARACWVCGDSNLASLNYCGNCGTAEYCSKKCQRGDWTKHSSQCAALSRHKTTEMLRNATSKSKDAQRVAMEHLLQQGMYTHSRPVHQPKPEDGFSWSRQAFERAAEEQGWFGIDSAKPAPVQTRPTGTTPWLARVGASSTTTSGSASYRLIHFGWSRNLSGEGCDYSTARWPAELGSEWEVYEVVLPGRLQQYRMPPRSSPDELCQELAAALSEALDGGLPYVFLGFAFGAVLAYETALAMDASQPALLCTISAAGPAWWGWGASTAYSLEDAAFVAALRERAGPQMRELLDEPELCALFLPTLRADASLEGTYAYADERLGTASTTIPVLAIVGAKPGRDAERTRVSNADAELWLEAQMLERGGNAGRSRVHTLPEHDWYLLEGADGTRAALKLICDFVQKHPPAR